jgi:hypothetical protein
MPWLETDVMKERSLFVLHFIAKSISFPAPHAGFEGQL